MKNIRKFEMIADKDAAVLEEYSVSYVNEENKVYTTPENSGQSDVDYSAMYTTFEALEDGRFSFQKKSKYDVIQYSKDNGTTWASLASGETVSVVSGDKVMWKSTITPKTSTGIGTFSSSNRFNAYGNTMSLLYGDDFKGQTSLEGNNYAFSRLFRICIHLIDTSNLIMSATTLSKNCYSTMFSGCTSLTTAPELPATTLADGCYYGMFSGCTSLTKAPSILPATTLTESCYAEIFIGCTNLITAPELPATTLADGCYYGMFSGCTSLTTAPSILPATTLTVECCFGMFSNCTSLTTSPELPATTLAEQCYKDMFWGCTSLTKAPSILPATTLTDSCYDSMFWGCTSLTKAPVLPATKLAYYCYDNMFRDCTSLNHITMLATDISATYCLNDWVSYVSSTGTFVKHPDMDSLPTSVHGIPYGWTVEDAVL